MAEWAWVIGGTPTSGVGPTRRLTKAHGRRVTWRVDAACDAQFSLNGKVEEIFSIVPLQTDLFIYRDGVLLFRGRIGTLQGTVGTDGHEVQFSAVDYRGMLNRRIVGAAGAYYPPGTDQAAIAWDLISDSQALSGGNLGITNGAGSTSGTTRERTYDPGKPIGDAIGELGRVGNGFEWEVAADLSFNRYYPLRNVDNNVKFDFGGIVKSVTYNFNPDDFADSVLVTGDQSTVPVTATAAGIATDPRGRWEKSQGFSTVIEQATLNEKGPWYLGQTDTIRYAYHVSIVQGRWGGQSDFWIGDTVHPDFQSGWLQEYGLAHRIVELQAVLDGDGGEAIDCGILATGAGDSNAHSAGGIIYDPPYDFSTFPPDGGGNPLDFGAALTTHAAVVLTDHDGTIIVWR